MIKRRDEDKNFTESQREEFLSVMEKKSLLWKTRKLILSALKKNKLLGSKLQGI